MSWSATVLVALCGVVGLASGCGEVQEVAVLAGSVLSASYNYAIADIQAGGVSTVDIPALNGPWNVAQKVSIVPRLSGALHVSAAAEAEMRDWVAAGNKMVALGGYYTWSMVAVVFGFQETGSCNGDIATQTGACGGFCSGPATIDPDCSVPTAVVPAGAEVHYNSTGRAAVLSLPYGNGSVVYLGHKWASNPMPVGWDTLLHLALNLPCPTSTTRSSTSSTTASMTSSTSTSSASSTSTTSSITSTTTSSTRTSSSTSSSTTSSTRTTSSSTSSSTTSSTRTSSSTSSSTSSTSTTTTSSLSKSSTTTSSTRTTSSSTSSTTATSTSASSTSTGSSSTSTTASSTRTASSTSSSSTSSGTTSSTTGTSTTGSATTTSSSASDLTGVPAQVHALLRVGDAAASFAVEALKNRSNVTVAATRIDGMLVTVARLESLTPANNQSHVLIPVGEGATVRVPLSVVAQFADPQEGELILVVVSPDAARWTGLNDTLDSGVSIDAFLDVLSVDLRFLQSSGKLSADALREPIGITMNATYGHQVACATVDEETSVWGTDGLVARENEAGSVLCETSHLSIFSAILQGFLATLGCSQLVLLNADSIKNISVGKWYTEIGAVALWIILGTLAALFALGVFLDCRRDRNRKWSSEFLLVPIHTGAAAEAIAEEEAEQEKGEEEAGDSSPTCLEAAICAIASFFMGCLGFCQASSAARDAFDDIMSNWFECFGDVRSMLESICEGLELSAMSSGRMLALSRRVMSHMLLRSARRLTGASMAVSDDVVVFVIEDEDLHDYLVEYLADSEIWRTQVATPKTPASTPGEGPERNESLDKVSTPKISASTLGEGSHSSRTLDKVLPDWRDSDNPREAWYLLFQTVSNNIHGHINRHSTCMIPRIIFELFLVQNPLFAAFVFDIFMTCKMRVFLLCVDIMGVLMMSCVFAEASGGAKRAVQAAEDHKCGNIPGDIGFRIGRLLAIALISILLAGIPASILGSLHTRSFKKLDYCGSTAWKKQLKAWAIQDRAVWILGSLYMAFCLFFVILFLSNVSSQTHKEWANGLGIIFLQDLLLLPLFLALIMPSLGLLLLGCNTMCHKMPRVQLIRGIQEQLHDSTNVMLPITRL